MDGISGAPMSAAEFAVNYTVAVEKKAMDTAEMAAQEMLSMLAAVPKGQYIDTYA